MSSTTAKPTEPVPEPGSLTELEAAIMAVPELHLTDPEQVNADIARRILDAKTIDDVLAQQSTTPAEDVVGLPFTFLSVKFLESGFTEGARVYAVIDAVNANGQHYTVTTGAGTILAQLYQAWRLKAYPFGARFVKASKATTQGYYPMWLEPADPDNDF